MRTVPPLPGAPASGSRSMRVRLKCRWRPTFKKSQEGPGVNLHADLGAIASILTGEENTLGTGGAGI